MIAEVSSAFCAARFSTPYADPYGTRSEMPMLHPLSRDTYDAKLCFFTKDLIEALCEIMPPKLDLMGLVEEAFNASQGQRFIDPPNEVPMLTRKGEAHVVRRIVRHAPATLCTSADEIRPGLTANGRRPVPRLVYPPAPRGIKRRQAPAQAPARARAPRREPDARSQSAAPRPAPRGCASGRGSSACDRRPRLLK